MVSHPFRKMRSLGLTENPDQRSERTKTHDGGNIRRKGRLHQLKTIKIITGSLEMQAELNNSKTAALVREQLPIEGRVSTWGDEIYFPIPVKSGSENAVSVVEEGDLAYWPEGNCFCIFFGLTPASTGSEIRPAGPVNPIGRLKGEPGLFKEVKSGSAIRLEET